MQTKTNLPIKNKSHLLQLMKINYYHQSLNLSLVIIWRECIFVQNPVSQEFVAKLNWYLIFAKRLHQFGITNQFSKRIAVNIVVHAQYTYKVPGLYTTVVYIQGKEIQ